MPAASSVAQLGAPISHPTGKILSAMGDFSVQPDYSLDGEIDMVTKKQMDNMLKDLANPRILTLDESLVLREEPTDPGNVFCNQDPDGRTVDAVLDRIGTRFSGPHNIGALNLGERLVLEVNAMHDEVLNGGFHQYLWNSSGDGAEMTRKFLRAIGSKVTGDLLDRVSAFFPNGYIPEEREDRQALLEQFEEANPGVDLFVEEDRVFYQQTENLNTLLVRYIADHRDEFENPTEDIVKKYKKADAIREHLGVEDDPKLIEEAEQSLKILEERFEAMQAEFLDKQRQYIRDLVAQGRKKEAMKEYRSTFDCSLSEAKDAVEAMKESP
jgi:ribosomal protein L7/L12